MILTIAGTPGSGKSTVAKLLAEELKHKGYSYEIIDVGQLRRDAAKEKNMTLQEFNDWSKENPKLGDRAFEEYVAKIVQTKQNAVVVGRMAFYAVPQSVKLFITVDEKIGAERSFSLNNEQLSRNEDVVKSVEAQMQKNKERVENDTARYLATYNLNPYDTKHFDVVIDSTKLTPREVCKKIIDTVFLE